MLEQFTNWLLGLVRNALDALVELLQDVFVFIVQTIVGVLTTLLGLIPVPDALAQGLQPLFNGLGAPMVWILAQAGLPQALAIIGSGYAFRLGRKVVTLFQW